MRQLPRQARMALAVLMASQVFLGPRETSARPVARATVARKDKLA